MPSAKKRLRPIDQKWYDENRDRFDANTTTAPLQSDPHEHYYRREGRKILCSCGAGLYDDGSLNIKDGKLQLN